jgi:hypothetical protein
MNGKKKSLIGVVGCAAWILAANGALSGEITGNGKPVPGGENGKSECSYSGQQDNAEADAGFFRGDRVQSWGQVPVGFRLLLISLGWTPGSKDPFPPFPGLLSCNPNVED